MTQNKYITIKTTADSKFKTAAVCLMLRRPLVRDEATKNSLLASVLGAGSMKYPNLYEINKYMEELYGAMFGSMVIKKGEFQIIRLYIEFPLTKDGNSELLVQAVTFLHEILFNPLIINNEFSSEIFENEKNMLRDSIFERINDKNSYVRQRCIEHMCTNEPFGIYADGYHEDLNALDSKALYAHYKELIRTTPLEFIASGNIDCAAFEKLVLEKFSNYHYEPLSLNIGPIVYNPGPAAYHEEVLQVNQGKVCMGLRTGCDYKGRAFYTSLVLNEILGGSGNSKLFMNLREKSSLCYSIFSFLYRAKSILMIQSGVESDNIEKAIEQINEQIEIMKKGQISDDELYLAKQGLVSGFKSITDSQGGVLEFNYSQHVLADDDCIEDIISGINAVSVADVVSLAAGLYTDTVYVLKGEKEVKDE